MDKKIIKFGFSLVEICIVCGILAAFLIPVFTLMSKSTSGTIKNRNEILAQQYASNVIAFCNVAPFDSDILKEADSLVISDTGNTLGGIELELPEELKNIAKKTISVKKVNQDKLPYEYKIVTVKVEWQQPGDNKKRNVTITGLVSNI